MAKTAPQGSRAKKGESLEEWLDGQIAWYDRKASANQRTYKTSKILIILCALAIPVVAEYGEIPGFHDPRALIVAILAGAILLLEGLQHLNKWQENWILYRSTCEALRHEQRMFQLKAGPYAELKGPAAERALAERTASLVMAEHGKWTVTQREKAESTTGH